MTDLDDFYSDRWTGRPSAWVRRPRDRNRTDPLKARLGAALVVFLLLVPVAFTLRSNDPVLVGADAPGAVALVTPSGANATAAATTSDSTDVSSGVVADMSADMSVDGMASAAAAALLSSAVSTSPPASPSSAVPVASSPANTQSNAQALSAATATEPTVAPAEIATEAASTAERSCGLWFTVRPGDYWIGLAAASEVALRDLLAANRATVDTKIHPGQDICLPPGARTPPSTTTTTTTTTAAPTTTKPPAPTTTKAPATTSPPAHDPNRTYSRAEVIQIIRDVWPDHLEEKAILIAKRESTYNPTAKNWCCYGVFQIYYSVHRGWLAGIGITSAAQLYDPHLNVQAAYTLYQRSGGWGPWSQTAG